MRPYVLLALAVAASAQGQRKVVPSEIGVLYRYNGDTIWHERDTTVKRSIFRGDTIFNETTRAGRLRHSRVYLVVGDSARVISAIDSTGTSRPPAKELVTARFATSSRDMLARQQQLAGIRERLRRHGYGHQPPLAPPNAISYCIDSTRSIVHQADTARDIRKSGGRVDTAVYVFVGDTTVKRLSPSPQTFGHAMYNTLFGEMHMSIVRGNLAPGSSTLEKELPGQSASFCIKR